MTRRLKHRLLIGVAVVAVLAGITTAVVMAAQPAAHHRRGGTLATAAGYLGLSPVQLRSELQSGKSLAHIADATSGKCKAGLIAALKAASKQRLAATAASCRDNAAEVDRISGPRTRTCADDYDAARSRAGRRCQLPRRQRRAAPQRAALREDARTNRGRH